MRQGKLGILFSHLSQKVWVHVLVNRALFIFFSNNKKEGLLTHFKLFVLPYENFECLYLESFIYVHSLHLKNGQERDIMLTMINNKADEPDIYKVVKVPTGEIKKKNPRKSQNTLGTYTDPTPPFKASQSSNPHSFPPISAILTSTLHSGPWSHTAMHYTSNASCLHVSSPKQLLYRQGTYFILVLRPTHHILCLTEFSTKSKSSISTDLSKK